MRLRLTTMTLALLTLLCACGEPFLNPPVVCPVRTFAFTLISSPPRVGQPCNFGDYPFSIASAPRADTFRDPDAKDYALARGRVTVTAGSTAVLLCAGSGQSICMGGTPEITTVISDTGVLSYQGVFTTQGLSPLQPGGMIRGGGPLVFENYGPGNQCTIDSTYDFSCQPPVK